MKKNDTFTLKIEDLNAQGQGVCHVDGQALFVPGALPGESVRVQVIKVTSRYAVGKLLGLESRSSLRTAPPCPYYPRCGGCSWQHMERSLQLSQKEQNLRMAFRKVGMTVDPEPILSGESWHYRNKGQFPVVRCGLGSEIGMYAARSHRLVPVDSCMIEEEPINDVLKTAAEWKVRNSISAYDETTGKGLLRHVCARHVSGQTMAVFVVTDFALPGLDDLLDSLKNNVQTLSGLILNLNTRRDNRIFGDKQRIVWGKDTLRADLNGMKLEISALSFMQVNTEGMLILYDTVAEFAQISENDIVYDAYCGTGSIGLYTARHAKALYGVEEVESAVLNARTNALLNGMDRAVYVTGKAEDVFPKWVRSGHKPDVLIVDPPFKGCEKAFLDAVIEADPDKLVYVSCNPATLARDVSYMSRYGYTVRRIRPVDLFPQSEHVECVTLITHK